MISEPNSQYVGHVTPETGTAANILKAITDFLSSKELPETDILAVGCDGTNVNTGAKGGIITLWECQLQRPLQWLICQLHANELPLRRLMNYLDGDTSGPRGFSGDIGKSLANCNSLPVQQFQPIDSEIPIILKLDLSTDQQYLYDMCQTIVSGVCCSRLAKRDPGKIVHSRWLTLANRVLRLYISTSIPSESLQTLATFIIKVYAPCWFSIKLHHSCTNGAQHVHESIKRSRYLSDSLKAVIDPVLQRNAYFAHCENILLSMIFDPRVFVRQLAYKRIMKARSFPTRIPNRKFIVPKLNFEANEYFDLITWQDLEVTEPPILSLFSDAELNKVVLNPTTDTVTKIRNIPCNTQAVERAVKIVTEVSGSVCGAERRDGMIRTKIKARQILPVFNTKKEYKL